MKHFFLDGDIVYKGHTGPDDLLYSSMELKGKQFRHFGLPADVQKDINYQAFGEVVDFYNKNKSRFLEFEQKTGLNIWFLEHFRLYFTYRNFLLKLATIASFLEQYPEAKVLTSDGALSSFLDDKKIVICAATGKAKQRKRLIKELMFQLGLKSKKPSLSSGIALFTQLKHNKGGKDPRFSGLDTHYERLLVREIFYREQEAPNRKHPEGIAFSDRLMGRYLRSLKWLGEVPAFNKAIAALQASLVPASDKESVLSHFFFKNKGSFIAYYLRYQSFNKWFAKTDLKGIVLIDENSAQQKVIQHAAQQNGIKVFALQHGTIHDLHPAYIYGQYSEKPLLPNITFVWGQYFREMLTKAGGYRPQQVSAVGRIGAEIPSRGRTTKSSKKKRTILYASQPQRDERLRRQNLKDVLKTCKKLEHQLTLIIRPHPRELNDPIFNEVATEVGFNGFTLDGDASLIKHFEICDVLITSFSTVGAEFVPYRKPMLILDYLKQDLIGYIRQGVGIEISSAKSLAAVLEKAELPIDEKAYDHFLEQYFIIDEVPAYQKIKNQIDAHV